MIFEIMEEEKLILKFNLQLIAKLTILDMIVRCGYKRTGNKFSVSFNGSKGYMDNVEISCEGWQKENNRIDLFLLTNKNGSLKSKIVNIYHSEAMGVRISIGNDNPKIFKQEVQEINTKKNIIPVNDQDDDLPF